ncbi:MAG: peptidoglycan-associated lipoprotein Pal [Myxococcota bacterium]
MTRESISRLVVLGVMALFVGVGCQTTQQSTDGESPVPDSEWNESSTPSDGGASSRTPLGNVETVYFDFDKSDIRPDARATLKANADAIGSGPGDTITIEGHCDERGSSEYNLALGERRANAVKRYLVDLGVPSSRLRTVSFGEDRPAVQGHDESAWRYNRRADFVN